MWLEGFLRGQFRRLLTREDYIALESRIPFGLIFLSTYLTGLVVEAQSERPRTVL